MGLFRTTKYFIAAPKILKTLLIDNWENPIIDGRQTTISLPFIYDLGFILEKTATKFLPKEIIRDAMEMLEQNGDIRFKVKNLENKYDGKILITDKGIKSHKESFYQKQVLLKWWKILGLSIVVIFSMIKWIIPNLVDMVCRLF
jgi:hypothetical protein